MNKPDGWPDDGLRLVLVEGARQLREKASPLGGTAGWRYVARALQVTCKAAGGLGLAATQIGIPLRVITIDGGDTVFVNPEIVEASTATWTAQEACLSQPGVQVAVRRSTRVVVRHNDGEDILQGMRGRVVQHEIDHLDGKLITDHGARLGPTGWGSPWQDVTPEKLKGTPYRPVFCPGCGHSYPWRWHLGIGVGQGRCFSSVCVKNTKGDGTLITVKGWRPWR